MLYIFELYWKNGEILKYIPEINMLNPIIIIFEQFL